MKKFLYIILFSLLFTLVFAEPRPSNDNKRPARPSMTRPVKPSYRLLRPSSTKKLEEDYACELSIQTNVSSAEVYINGHYEGRTNLLVKGLRPSVYSVELRKSGYENEFFDVELRPGYRNTYSVNMQKIYGRIEFYGLSSNSKIYINGSLKNGNVVEMEPGYHQVEIKRFGYKPYTETVHVRAYEYTDVYPKFVEAPFEINNFKISRTTINPDYNNLFGKVDFSFSVSANGTAEIVVLNQKNEVVWNNKWNSFSTWEQSITFTGKNNHGEVLPDGNYIVKLISGSYSNFQVITIDRSISYSLMGINTKGSGIGSVPVVFDNDMSLVIPYLQAGFALNEKVHDNFGDFKVGLLFDLVKHFEMNLSFGVLPGGGVKEKKNVQFSSAIKLFDTVPVGKNNFCYGGLIHWSFTGDTMPLPMGIDNGTGLGFGAMTGLDLPFAYFGLTTDYIMAAEDGKHFNKGSVWKNSIAAALKIGKTINLDGWFAINSAIHNPDLSPNYNTDLLWAADYGGELLFAFGNSSLIGDLKVQRIKVFMGPGSLKFTFGLSYLL